jgi:hypothetical protein
MQHADIMQYVSRSIVTSIQMQLHTSVKITMIHLLWPNILTIVGVQ